MEKEDLYSKLLKYNEELKITSEEFKIEEFKRLDKLRRKLNALYGIDAQIELRK